MGKDEKVKMPLYDAFVHLLDTGEIDEVFDAIETIVDDPACHEDIYRLAKRYYEDNKPLSIKLINTLTSNRKYFNGFRAYTYCIDQDEKGIDDMVNYLKITFLVNQTSEEAYTQSMDEIIFSVAELCPDKTKVLMEEMQEAIYDVRTGNVIILDE